MSGSNYLLTGRNASQFAGYGGFKTLPRYFSTFSKVAGRTSFVLGGVSVMSDMYLVSQGQMSTGRAMYHLGGFAASAYIGFTAGATTGGPFGAVIGFGAAVAFYGVEVLYDEVTRDGGTIDYYNSLMDRVTWDFYEFNNAVNNNWFRPQY